MDALPIRPQPPAHRPHRPAQRAAAAADAQAAATHANAAHAPNEDPGDRVLLAQRGFDETAALLAEQAREGNVLRSMAMAQLKHDDQTMNDWIKMI